MESELTQRVVDQETKETEIPQKEQSTVQKLIGPICHAPQFLKDHYINHGYRINFQKKQDALKSLFMWHNELVNIWTHLVGAILIIGLVLYVIFGSSELIRPKAIEQFNDTLHSFYAEAVKLEEMINSQVINGYDHIKEDVIQMQQEMNNKMSSITGYISDFASHEILEIQAKIHNSFDWQTLSWTHDLAEMIGQYKERALDLLEQKDFDWVDLYLEFSQLTGQDISKRYTRLISRGPIVAFLISAMMCLICSTIYHLFYCISETANKVLVRLDYAGICFLISGSTFPPLFYGFQCHPNYAIGYAILQGVLASIIFGMSLCDFFHSPEWRSTKNKLFAGLGFSSAIPVVHLIIGDAWLLQGYSFSSQLPYYAAMAVSYLSGLYIYSVRFPEKHLPGKFDNCGQSHQIWHVSVVVAILFTYVGALNAYYTRLDQPCLA